MNCLSPVSIRSYNMGDICNRRTSALGTPDLCLTTATRVHVQEKRTLHFNMKMLETQLILLQSFVFILRYFFLTYTSQVICFQISLVLLLGCCIPLQKSPVQPDSALLHFRSKLRPFGPRPQSSLRDGKSKVLPHSGNAPRLE